MKSSHKRCSVKKVFLNISQNSQENTCLGVSFLINLQAFELQHRCFPVKFAKILTTFFTEYLRATAFGSV